MVTGCVPARWLLLLLFRQPVRAARRTQMASLLAKIWSRICPKRKPLSIMIVGLDNSGKTSILNTLATNSSSTPSRSQSPASSRTNEPENKPIVGSSRSGTPDELREVNIDTRLSLNFEDDDDDDDDKDNYGNRDTNHSNLLNQDNLGDNTNRSASPNGGNIMPTVGYNYERVQYKNLTMTVLDFSGQNKYRSLWQEFYNCVDGIVFVIDSSDSIRFVVVRDELENLLAHPYFSTLAKDKKLAGNSSTFGQQGGPTSVQKQLTISQGKLVQSPLETPTTTPQKSTPATANSPTGRRTKVPILFLANKADLANSVSTELIVKALNLGRLPSDRHPWFVQATSVSTNQGIVQGFDWLMRQLTAVNVT